MNAIHIRRKLESETLHLPQLRPWLGKDVEIVVREATPAVASTCERSPTGASLLGSVIRYVEPLEPAAEPQAWEANR